ncbi:hypothetical protein V1Y59_22565 [Gordonia sp. PKS22-38]|uniref:Uncharacterized protein n=1 Tax=Gordonia prachuapensis TaxID=3115651 RepID=A0ABU7N1G8_9ACTN|nr:hypothetical protein [Gordonia sp. PKS22-38]
MVLKTRGKAAVAACAMAVAGVAGAVNAAPAGAAVTDLRPAPTNLNNYISSDVIATQCPIGLVAEVDGPGDVTFEITGGNLPPTSRTVEPQEDGTATLLHTFFLPGEYTVRAGQGGTWYHTPLELDVAMGVFTGSLCFTLPV